MKGWFGIVDNEITRDATLPPESRLIYAILAGYADKERICWPSIETLVKDCGMTKTRFYKYMHVLRNRGIVEVFRDRNGNLQVGSNIYRLNDNIRDSFARMISGWLYDCQNMSCPGKQAHDAEAAKAQNERNAVRKKNAENGIDIDLIREQSRKVGITVYDMSKRLCLLPSEWCDRIYGRKSMEPGIAIRAMNEILTAKETQKDEFIRKAAVYEMLNELGGCDATDEWSKGWDKAIDTSIDSLEKMKGESL